MRQTGIFQKIDEEVKRFKIALLTREITENLK